MVYSGGSGCQLATEISERNHNQKGIILGDRIGQCPRINIHPRIEKLFVIENAYKVSAVGDTCFSSLCNADKGRLFG